MKVNVQGGEAIFRNENGDTIIVPRNRRNEAMKYLLKDDHHSLDKLALDLPKAEHYASGGTVIPEDPIEGMMGPETTITAKRPEKSIGNFLNRWGYEHSKDPATSFLGAVGQGLGAIAQLPQAAATYMLDPKGNVLPSKALQGTQIQKDIEMSAAQGNIGAKILKRPIVQDMLLDPLLLTSEIAKGVSKGSELINGLKKSELINDLGNKYLPNAHKLNPFAFKPNSDAYYRGIGRTGLDDALESGYLRAKNSKLYGEDVYMSPNFDVAKGNYSRNKSIFEGDPFGIDDSWKEILPKDGKSYIAEIPKNKLTNPEIKGAVVAINKGPLPIDDVRLLKQDWLKGYKEVPKPKSTLSPISKSWQIQDLPGLHLQSTMSNGPISKIIEPKTGLVNTEQALAIIAKESGGNDKVALIRQGLGNNIPKKVDYNEFRKTVQDQLIPLERQFATHSSDYGIERLGYSPKLQGSVFNRFQTFMNTPVSDLGKSRVLENQTLILGNKSKFGRGSSAHGNPEETLGHVHFLRDAESPDVLTVTQIQSDAFQGTHRIMPDKSKKVPEFFKQREEQRIQNLKKSLEEEKVILNKYKTNKVDNDGYPIHKSQIEQIEESVRKKEQEILFKDADLKNLPQKQLLDKNHQERYLQELVDYAGKRGDVNKVRVPTSETAAKVQNYSPIDEVGSKIDRFKREMAAQKQALLTETNAENKLVRMKNIEHYTEQISELSKLGADFKFSPEHQTILKKYAEQPKTIKKLFGIEPKVVTDKKGNTWYEFDIPKKFKEGKGEIKALSTLGATLGVKQIIDNNKQQ